MALSWRQIGTNPDGTPQFTVESDQKNPHIVLTGPDAQGVVRLPNGMSYDVSAPAIEVASEEHAQQVSHLIAEQHEQAGRYGLSPEDPHECGVHCSLKRKKG